jgi:hypothetical protein
MNWQPFGVLTAEQRDQAAEDRDEAAWQRDRASAARDWQAGDRDGRAQTRTQAALQYARLTRRLLDAADQHAGQEPAADRHIVRGLLERLDQALQDAEVDRRAALGDRRAAAADRRRAADDRFVEAAHRGQAAIERAQQAPGTALASEERRNELCALARSARAHAATLRGRASWRAAPQ